MARKIEPHENVARDFDAIIRSVRNLFIENNNFRTSTDSVTGQSQPAYYYEAYPNTRDFVQHVLRKQAETLIENLEWSKEVAVMFSNIREFSTDELEAEIARRKAETNPSIEATA